jgi:hypothetical protein
MNTPSVVVTPVRRPAMRAAWATSRVVVVLPLVPVTATTGIRPLSSPNRASTMAAPASRGAPRLGYWCMRMPGAALTSMMPPRCSCSGWPMSWHTMSMPATSRPMVRAARMQISRVSSGSRSVTSSAVPPVDRLALPRRSTDTPSGGTVASVQPCAASTWSASSSSGILVRMLVWPSPRAGLRFSISTSCCTVCTPSPVTCGGRRQDAAATLRPVTSTR